MARTQVGSVWETANQIGDATTIALPSRNITAGSLVVVAVRYESVSTTVTLADTAGGSWQVQQAFNTNVGVALAWSYNHPGGTGVVITATFSAARAYRNIAAIELDGSDASNPAQLGAIVTSAATLNHSMAVTTPCDIFAVQGNYNAGTYAASSPAIGLTPTSSALFFFSTRRDVATSPATIANTGGSGNASSISLAFSYPASSDTTAPTLTSASASATSGTTSSGSVTTDEANGTLYWLTNTSGTATATAVKAGSSQAVTAAGAQSTSSTGLSPGTTYYTHFLHRDAAGNDSAVLSSASFATPALSASITLTTDGTTPAASLTGLTWGWWDAYPPNTASAPLVGGSAGTTNGSGVFTATLTGTTLTAGQTGTLLIVKGDGTEGSTANNAFCGPVVVG